MARVEAVDFAKGVAITSIMIFHCYEAIFVWPGHDLFMFTDLLRAYKFFPLNWEITKWGLLKMTGLGYQGVSVFVVLSGFLQMWGNRDKEMNSWKYYLKRFLRIYPLYWLAILGILALNLILHGNPGATEKQIFGAFMGWAPLLPLNPSFWFMILIIQLYLFFPLLHGLYFRLQERKFLTLCILLTILSISFFTFTVPWGGFPFNGFFFGCWLFEFSLGMVMANHYPKVDSMLRGAQTIALLFLAYLLGLYLSSAPVTWSIGRPLYGIALTLLTWSIYNMIKEIKKLHVLKRLFTFIGINSFAMYMINQPFIQEYFFSVTEFIFPYRILFFGNRIYIFKTMLYQHLRFQNEIHGVINNMYILPISTYLLILTSYTIFIISLSFVLTKIYDKCLKSIY